MLAFLQRGAELRLADGSTTKAFARSMLACRDGPHLITLITANRCWLSSLFAVTHEGHIHAEMVRSRCIVVEYWYCPLEPRARKKPLGTYPACQLFRSNFVSNAKPHRLSNDIQMKIHPLQGHTCTRPPLRRPHASHTVLFINNTGRSSPNPSLPPRT